MEYYAPEHCFFSFPDNRLFKYDIASNTWSQVSVTGSLPSCYGRNVVYDTLNKVFAVFSGSDAGCEFHYYSPVEKRWYKINRMYPTGRVLFHHHIYDPVNNVHILASRGSDYFWQTLAFKLSDTPGKFPGTGINPPSTVTGGAHRDGMAIDVTASPNPFTKMTSIRISSEFRVSSDEFRVIIFDLKGRKLATRNSQLETSFTWNASGLPSGIYLLKASVNGKSLTKRLFLQK
jgi:hypothetical protein